MVQRNFDQAASARRAISALLGCVALTATAQPAFAASRNDQASEIAAEAMAEDFADGDPSSARRKLQRALKRCKKRCSPEVESEIYRDLGIVYMRLRKKRQAQDAFEKAVVLDAAVKLPREWATPKVRAAFEDAGGNTEGLDDGEDQDNDSEDDESEEASGDSEDEDSPKGRRQSARDANSRSWLSLTLQQDWQLHGERRPVCGSDQYTCFEGSREYTGQPWDRYGNQVSSGIALATTRLLLGFDYLLSDHFGLGARLGYAFRGGPKLKEGAFLPIHGELRVAYYVGSAPFNTGIIHPFLALAGGIADVRSRIDVDYYDDAQAYNEARKERVDAWRKTGRIFLSPSLGAHVSLSRSFALTLELRWMALFGSSGSAPAASVGFALGL